jgi:ABC-type branched-subunit amino acid transport system substrate-binding protein
MRIGLLFDYPQGGDGMERTLRLGLKAAGIDPSSVTFTREETLGLPAGRAEDTAAGFARLADAGVDLVIGPSISDNCLAARDEADRYALPAINYSGGERTRSDWMFHYQIGSLEDEPPLLIARMGERTLSRAAVIHDASVVGDRYVEVLEWAAREAGVAITGRVGIDPLTEDLGAVVRGLRAGAPDVLVYLGLGAASHAVAVAMADAEWTIPVLANSALMFGYVRPDWRDAWARWEYIDTIADDNTQRAALAVLDAAAAAGPIGTATYDLGRLAGHAMQRAERIDRAGLREGLERVKQLPAASGYDGTLMGFGAWDRGALKGRFLVLRAWRDGRTVQVDRSAG